MFDDVQCHIAAIMLSERVSYICFIARDNDGLHTLQRAKIESTVPKKKTKSNRKEYEKEMNRYYRLIQRAMEKYLDIDSFRCVLLLSRDGLNIKFNNHLRKSGIRANCFLNLKYSGGVSSIHEDPEINSQIEHVHTSYEEDLLDTFIKKRNTQPDKTIYGFKEVRYAIKEKAVQAVLVPNESLTNQHRELLKEVEKYKGEIHVLYYLEEERIMEISGIAAFLRYPIEVPDSDEEKDCEEGSI